MIRDVQYAVDAGGAVFGPGFESLLKRVCAVGRRRADLTDAIRKTHEADLKRCLERLPALDPAHAAGIKLRRMFRMVRSRLFV